MFIVVPSRYSKLVPSFFPFYFFVIRWKLGQSLVLPARSLKFPCSNLNLDSVRCILLCQLWECESHEACSIVSKCLKVHVWLLLFFGVDLCRNSKMAHIQALITNQEHLPQCSCFKRVLFCLLGKVRVKYTIKGSHLNMYTVYKLRLYVTTTYYIFFTFPNALTTS